MNKMLLHKSSKYCFLGLLLFSIVLLNACGKGNLSENAQKIEGTWLSSHEPMGYVFKADGKFDMIDTAPEAVRESGTWSVEGDKLTTTIGNPAVKEVRKINFVEGLLYLGDLPEFDANCAECPYKNVGEYVKEMGLKKK